MSRFGEANACQGDGSRQWVLLPLLLACIFGFWAPLLWFTGVMHWLARTGQAMLATIDPPDVTYTRGELLVIVLCSVLLTAMLCRSGRRGREVRFF